MKDLIIEKLADIEQQFDVKILYACESGSRAWGFASPDSDYDARFIYVHKRDHYLSIDEQRDVIELPINSLLDISGWELRKALRLFRKSNGPLYEWLQSPIVYKKDDAFFDEITSLMESCFGGRAAMHHYLSMAKGVYENELAAEKVKLKKYFYALRPVLAAKWIADFGGVPPMEFGSLRKLMPDELQKDVDNLLAIKATVDERYLIDKQSALDTFIGKSIEECERKIPEAVSTGDNEKLNALFRKYIV